MLVLAVCACAQDSKYVLFTYVKDYGLSTGLRTLKALTKSVVLETFFRKCTCILLV